VSAKPFITVTGADEETDILSLQKLDAEIGLLYTTTPEGRRRYPGRDWIKWAAINLDRVAIHICGGGARRELMSGDFDDLVCNADRIQVNGPISVADCQQICTMFPEHTIITQHNHKNLNLLKVHSRNHAILVDASGGRGITPGAWHRPETEKQVGFAGGLGSDNLAMELSLIRVIATGDWWVDMEGKLRVDDYFSFERARDAVTAFHASMEAMP
jgi:hypothetical protein